jgi:hypothetical protein
MRNLKTPTGWVILVLIVLLPSALWAEPVDLNRPCSPADNSADPMETRPRPITCQAEDDGSVFPPNRNPGRPSQSRTTTVRNRASVGGGVITATLRSVLNWIGGVRNPVHPKGRDR